MSNFSSIDYNSLDAQEFLYVHEYDNNGKFQRLYRITKSQFDDLFFKNEPLKLLSKLQNVIIILTIKNGCLRIVLDSPEQLKTLNPFNFF